MEPIELLSITYKEIFPLIKDGKMWLGINNGAKQYEVPEKYADNPDQFEIVGMGEDNGRGQSGNLWQGGSLKCLVNGNAKFKRIFIKRVG